ncbi:MAG TPA: MFS transporter [Ktedonobacteraceae bacterium]|nr:MFS transporter [Ktedonobacteraceae bacterium]
MKLVKRARNTALPLLLGTFLLRINGGASALMVGRFMAQLVPRHGHAITSIEVGLLSIAYFVVELSLAPLMGGLSDRWGRRTFLALGPLFGLLQVALLFFTPDENPFPYLLCLQVLAGISSAMQVPAVLGYLADYTAQQPALRVRVMSLYELATSGGLAVGVATAGFAWDQFGRFAFFLLAAGYLVAACCMLSVPQARQVIEHGNARSLARRYWQIVRSPRLFIFMPAWVSIFALVGIWYSSQLTFILSSRRHLPGQFLMGSLSGAGGGGHLSLILGSVVLFFGLCLLFWAFFLNRVSRLLLMLFSIGGVYLACIALAGLNHSSPDTRPLLICWVVLLLIGTFAETGFAPAALSYLADISEETSRDRGLLMGLYSVFLGLGQLLGNGLGGFFAQGWGFDGLIYLTALLACVSLVSLLFLVYQERRVAIPRDMKRAE